MLDALDRPRAENDIRLTGENGRHELVDVRSLVLAVGIGVHDDIGSSGKGGLQPSHEGAGQSSMGTQLHDVVHSTLTRDLHGAVATAVIDNLPLDSIEPGKLFGQIRQSRGQLLLLVEARNLDDQQSSLHSARWPFSRIATNTKLSSRTL